MQKALLQPVPISISFSLKETRLSKFLSVFFFSFSSSLTEGRGYLSPTVDKREGRRRMASRDFGFVGEKRGNEESDN